jgi:hypothetical protein
MIIELQREGLGDFLETFAPELAPLDRDIIFGHMLQRQGYPTRPKEICSKHKVSYASKWVAAVAHAIAAFRLVFAEHGINHLSDLPLPEPRYEVENRYIAIQIDNSVYDDNQRPQTATAE